MSEPLTRRDFLKQSALLAGALAAREIRPLAGPPPSELERLNAAGLENWIGVHSLSQEFLNRYGISPFGKISAILQSVAQGQLTGNSPEARTLKEGWSTQGETERRQAAVETAKRHLAGLRYDGVDIEETRRFLEELAQVYPVHLAACPPKVTVIPGTGASISPPKEINLASPVKNSKEATLVANFHELAHAFEYLANTLNPDLLGRVKMMLSEKDFAGHIESYLSVMWLALEIWRKSPWEAASIMKYGWPLFEKVRLEDGERLQDFETAFSPPEGETYKVDEGLKGHVGYRLSRLIHFVSNYPERFKGQPLFRVLMERAFSELEHFFVGPPQGGQVGTWPKSVAEAAPGVLTELNIMHHLRITELTSALPGQPTLTQIAERLNLGKETRIIAERKTPLAGEIAETYRLLTSFGAIPFGSGERYLYAIEGGIRKDYFVFELPDCHEDPTRVYLYLLFEEPRTLTMTDATRTAYWPKTVRGLLITVPKERYDPRLLPRFHPSEFYRVKEETSFRFQIGPDSWVELAIPPLGDIYPAREWQQKNDISLLPITESPKTLSIRQGEAPLIYRGGLGQRERSSGRILWFVEGQGTVRQFPYWRGLGYGPAGPTGALWLPPEYPDPSHLRQGFAILNNIGEKETLIEGGLPYAETADLYRLVLETIAGSVEEYRVVNPELAIPVPLIIRPYLPDEQTRGIIKKFIGVQGQKDQYGFKDNFVTLETHVTAEEVKYDLVLDFKGQKSVIIPLSQIRWG